MTTELTTAQKLRAVDFTSPWKIAHEALRAKAAAELEALQRSLTTEQMSGQEVHDYLCSINPDNQHLSVLEAVIQQRGIENSLRTQNQELREALSHIAKCHPASSALKLEDAPELAQKALALKPETK